MPRSRPVRRAPRARAVGAALLALAALAGCGSDLRPGAETIFDAVAVDPPPGELAAMALDPYDANRRYVGTLGLANQPFAREPIYLKLFLDNATDPDPLVRAAAMRGLAIHGRPEHAPIVIEGLRDADAAVRQEAARGLQRLHDTAAVDPLLDAMREPDLRRDRTTTARAGASRPAPRSEPDAQVRAEAAHALGQYAEPKVLQGLIAGLDDADLAVNRSALASLRTLTGQDFGLDRAAWTAWLNSAQDPFRGRSAYVFPAFNRRLRLYEYLPFVPPPPNEIATTPTGLPRS